MSDVMQKRAAFRALHRDGCFVIPNPWDIGSARLLQQLGFAALATTSSGFAWTAGRADYAVTRDDTLTHLAALCAAVDLPVNADFQSGFADAPEAVAENVRLAAATGIAGLSIEDRIGAGPGLYEHRLAVERIRAARAAIADQDVFLVARAEGLLFDPGSLSAVIDRLIAFAAAGADCLYAPGAQGAANIAVMVRAVAPKPLNVLMSGPGLSAAELADLGVRRISVGGALARVAWGAVRRAAEEMRQGSFEGLKEAASGKEMNALFAPFAT